MEPELGAYAGSGAHRGPTSPGEGPRRDEVMERSSRDFETQHKLLLLETLYDAGLSLGSLPNEEALVEDVLGRAVGVLDASRGYLATFGEGGARRAETRVGFARRPSEEVVAQDEFLQEVLKSETAVRRERFRFLRMPLTTAIGVAIRGGGREVGVLVLADKEARRGGRAAFDEEDARFLASLAGLCGMAIENRRHLERLTRDRERLEEENRRLLDETGRSAAGRLFIGDSPAARRVLDLVGRVAPSRTSVLITGESGTGKELVARMIHARSDRAEKPFVAINCAALPETLLESELFGIERGVATGVEARSGRFETANGGTLFLDEIGDMPLPLQAKLLRVLQEREIERVGGRKRIPIDVRVLAATNARLPERIARGEFREDLYYRLRVVEIALPPLRERREDIPKLVRHFLERFAAREGQGSADARPRGLRGASRARLRRQRPGAREPARGRGRAVAGRRHPARRPAVAPVAALDARRRGGSAAGRRAEPARARGTPHPARPEDGRRKQEPGGATAGHQPPHALPEEDSVTFRYCVNR